MRQNSSGNLHASRGRRRAVRLGRGPGAAPRLDQNQLAIALSRGPRGSRAPLTRSSRDRPAALRPATRDRGHTGPDSVASGVGIFLKKYHHHFLYKYHCGNPDIPVPPTGTPVFAPAASCPVGRLDHAGPLRILPLSPCSPLNKESRSGSRLFCTARTTNWTS